MPLAAAAPDLPRTMIYQTQQSSAQRRFAAVRSVLQVLLLLGLLL
jgi:hypothetical protein